MRQRRDHGSMSVYAAIISLAMLACVVVFVNAAARWNTWRDANSAADAAARAGAQVTTAEYNPAERRLRIDPVRAQARASSVLSAQGFTGTASVAGNTVTVIVSANVNYVLPGPTFGDWVEATGVATVEVGAGGVMG